MRRTTLRARLLALVAAVAVPLVALGVFSVVETYENGQARIEGSLLEQARGVARALDEGLAGYQAILEAVARGPALMSGNMAETRSMMERLSAELDATLVLAGQDGEILAATAGTVVPSRPGTASPRGWAVAASAGKPAVTDLTASPVTGRPVIEVSVAAPGDGGTGRLPARALGIEIPPYKLDEIVAVDPKGDAPAVVVTILDREQRVIARTTGQEQWLGRQVPGATPLPDSRGEVLRGRQMFEGGAAMIARAKAGKSGLYVSLCVPESALGSRLGRALGITLVGGIGLTAFGIAWAWLVARRIAISLSVLGPAEPGVAMRQSGIVEVAELGRVLEAAAARRDGDQLALRESEARLQDLLASLDLANLMIRDMDGTIRFWSHGLEALYGWTAEEAVGRSVHTLLRTRFPVDFAAVQATLLRDGAWSGELRHLRRDGVEIVAAAHKVLRRDERGAPVAIMESIADITALRAAQEALEETKRTLEIRIADEVAAREAAQDRAAQAERMQALGKLAGGIAHDFNNVLQLISGAAALIVREPGQTEPARRFAGMIQDAAARGGSITSRLLAFARKSELRAEPVQPTGLLDNLRAIFAHTLGANIEVRASVVPGTPALQADKAQLETVLINLASNARDAMPQGGVLTLAAEPVEIAEPPGAAGGLEPGRYVRVSVSDTGVGMDAATVARITEPFFTTKPAGSGTGLGLPMAFGFASQSGGLLEITSERGRGTMVSLSLPESPPPGSDRAKAAAGAPRAHVDRSGRLRVLLVDDDDLIRETTAAQLGEFGHEVLEAHSGEAALGLLARGAAADCLLTDLSMPGMDGIELIRAAQARRPGLPALLMTGLIGSDMLPAVRGRITGAVDVVGKPVPIQDLLGRLGALVTEPADAAG